MTTLPDHAPPTLIDRIRDGMRGEEAKDKLRSAIKRTAEYLDGLRAMLARIDHTDVEIDDTGNVDGLDGLLRWIDENQQPAPPTNDDTQLIELGDQAEQLDGDAHRFLSKDEINALRIDATEFAMGPYDPLS